MARVLSGIQPSGVLHIGNYFGAVRQWVAAQHDEAYFTIVDLHALTLEIEPESLRRSTMDTAISLLAAGLDPDVCTLFVQSHVHEHTELTWLLECTASFGELTRMTQFKEKGEGRDGARAGLLTYPVLMAADILCYNAEEVPVGDDQRQHLELTRNLAQRFNSRYGETFVVPKAVIPPIGARVMDLQNPTRKMSKSAESPQGTVALLDLPDVIARKIKRAVTDTQSDVVYDPASRPGLANLLELLAVVTNRSPADLAGEYSGYGQLKTDLAEALVEALAPVRAHARPELARDPAAVAAALGRGAEKARAIASETLRHARKAVGLLIAEA